MMSKIGRFLGIVPHPAPEYSAQTKAKLSELTEQLSLYHFFSCPFCARVHRAVKQMGLDLELRDITAEQGHRDDLIQGGGRSTVPCLRIERPDGDVTWMYESKDIIQWLEHQVGALTSGESI